MRKYDSKNKKNIGIIVVICIIVAIIFSYFLIKEIKQSRIKYELEESTLVFDIDKNAILLNGIGTIKKKWDNKYYLTYEEEQYQIGTHVIAFNNKEISLTLYGEFYEVNKSSEINITKEETKLNNLNISRFYKISDRKYLIVDSSIKSEDNSLQTENYLIVELDKLGNAVLYNNNLNLKTFSETKLVTSNYTFDIANELLIYEDTTVDLKKILGTTNEYNKQEENKNDKTENKDNNDNGNNTDNPGVGTGNNTGTTGGNNNNQEKNNDVVTKEEGTDITDSEIINQTATTSVININPTTNSISVDYVIYDTMGKYLTTFIELTSSNTTNIIQLSKSATNVKIPNLIPGKEYTLVFKYTYKDNEEVKEEIFDTHKVKTLIPNISLVGTKVTSKVINYKINIDSYEITNAKLIIYVDGERQNKEISITSNNLTGEFDIRNIEISNDSLVELSLEDIYINANPIDKKISWYYKRSIEKNNSKPEEGENNE